MLLELCAQNLESRLGEARRDRLIRMHSVAITAVKVFNSEQWHCSSEGHAKFRKNLRKIGQGELSNFLALVELFSEKDDWYDSREIARRQNKERSKVVKYFSKNTNSKSNRGSEPLHRLVAVKKNVRKTVKTSDGQFSHIGRPRTGYKPQGFIVNLCHYYRGLVFLCNVLMLYLKIREEYSRLYTVDDFRLGPDRLYAEMNYVKERLRKARPAKWTEFIYENDSNFHDLLPVYLSIHRVILEIFDFQKIESQQFVKRLENDIIQEIAKNPVNEENIEEFLQEYYEPSSDRKPVELEEMFVDMKAEDLESRDVWKP